MSNLLLPAAWCFAASLLLPLLAWAAMPLLPRSAALRHLVWVAVFAALLLLPLVTLVVPSQILLHPAAVPPIAFTPAAPLSQGFGLADAIALLPLAWLAGVVWHLARLALSLYGLRRLRVLSAPFDDMREVRLSDEGPLTFGWLKPLILLPRDAPDWSAERLMAVLAHERAHVRRHDAAIQTLAHLVCTFYWPNPLLWLGSRAQRREAELAADDAVLAAGMRPSDYAAQLVQVAGERLHIAAAAMAASSLEARVKSILSPTPLRTGASFMDGLKIAWLGSAAVVALALVRPAIAQAQDPVMAQAAPRPAPATAPLPQVAPVADVIPPTPPVPPSRPLHHHHHINVTIDGDRLNDADRAKIDAAVARVQATMAGLRPQIERAVQQAEVERATAQSVQQAMPQIHAAIAQAMAQIQPVIHQVRANERLDVQVSVVLNRAQVQIDAAMARATRVAARAAAHAKDRAGDDAPPDPGEANP
jgi:beta-lactamase regulating signal transducer with metallopeptidase domain